MSSANKGLLLAIWLFVFYLIICWVVPEKVLSESGSQIIASNHKLLRARQLLIEGTDCLHNNQNQQAKLKLTEACVIAPDLPQVHHQLGIALAKVGENEAAINEFSTAIKLDDNVAASWLNLAAVYQSSGNIDQAKITYQEFISRFPQDKDISKIQALIEGLNATAIPFIRPTFDKNKKQSLIANANPDINQIAPSTQAAVNSSKEEPYSNYYPDIARRGIWIWSRDRLPLKVYIERARSNNGASTQYVSILKNAFHDWSSVSGQLLDFVFIDVANKADITCSWSKDLFKFKNSSEAANARIYAKNGLLDKGEIDILTVSADNFMPITDNQMRATALHEIGHIIGLTGHSSDPNDVMYISALLKDTWVKLSNRDINTIVRLYSANRR